MNNKRDDFKPGKKPFSKDGKNRPGSFVKFKRPGEAGGFEKSKYSARPEKFQKTGTAPKEAKNFKNAFGQKKPFRPDRPSKPAKPARLREFPETLPPVAEQEDSGMVYGRNAVLELLKSGKSVDKLFVQSGQREGSITVIFAEALKKSIPVIETEKSKLDSMIKNSAHQGVIAMAAAKEYCSIGDILKIAEERGEKPFVLIADKIMDPHNLGAIIRTAECAGVHGMIIPKRNAAGVSPIVAKISAGASVHMAIAKVANIAGVIDELKEKGIWIFSSALDLDENLKNSENDAALSDYSEADYDIPMCLVVGNEGEGLSPLVIQKSDFMVKIPMFGKIDSLNVSCACAVLMYEISRQRKKK
ncbi:MAG: 23S rRNA (guanosine(2251)-2'-O)-methyltransferase RlmB [Oscillospiraceae bacterium]|nr:23S rRNA (guanosine(2251)-2'-O)-methyltransferase RlmB [Oscillospiraceae bacterium]